MVNDRSKGLDEARLVQSCKENELSAQYILYNVFADEMGALCRQYIPDPEDAREAMMDGFLSFFKNIGGFTYQGPGSLKAWLKKIMVNQCLMQLRKRKKTHAEIDEDVIGGQSKRNETILSYLGEKEILKLLTELPDKYRVVFDLYVFEGLSHRQIGEVLNIPENTSKSSLRRAKQILKENILKLNKIKLPRMRGSIVFVMCYCLLSNGGLLNKARKPAQQAFGKQKKLPPGALAAMDNEGLA